ncbi:uncharacterized protein LOC126741410 isoform X2 [Anthonomus grandis grandis]|uniref:uncharacterized protein LOC126741410 isoform X2 n=1 Tax=Anthonomus grandis grandis TaxID=2921223 RepID=UPI0021659D06|nr:uncharacterized protein LOC126741410 isoform X2 [Anthonomus grandis grandis]XP_050303771.1 uncharacterized protein LOC126741410 isoform X2 [Anthonomus grandis grandis]
MDYKPVTPHKYAAKYTTAEFLLVFNESIIVVLGISLISLAIWSFIRKIAIYTYFMEIKIDPTFFAIPAGFLGLCSVVFALLLRTSSNFKYMLWFVVLQIIAIILLFTGDNIGTYYKLDFSNKTLHLSATIPREALNLTLIELLAIYDVGTVNNQTTFDKIQKKFGCCGVDDPAEFIQIPWSCCIKNDCEIFGNYPTGCLRTIREDVAWQTHITSSLCQLFLLMMFFNLAIVGSIYLSNRSKSKAILRAAGQSGNS